MSGPENYLNCSICTQKAETYGLKINCQGLNSGFCLKTGIPDMLSSTDNNFMIFLFDFKRFRIESRFLFFLLTLYINLIPNLKRKKILMPKELGTKIPIPGHTHLCALGLGHGTCSYYCMGGHERCNAQPDYSQVTMNPYAILSKVKGHKNVSEYIIYLQSL